MSDKKKSPAVTIVSYEVFHSDEFKKPSKYYIFTAQGDYLFVHTRDRKVAQQYIDECFGEGRYTVRADGTERPKGDVTCSSSVNSASRKGNSYLKQKSNYGMGEK